MSTITNDGSDIIKTKIDLKYNLQNNEETLKKFEIDETIDWILKNNYKKVGLQFPDELLPISVPILIKLRSKTDCEFGIMSDTSFGGCCVDEVGGEHFNVESIIHYGNSCLTSTHRKLPVKNIFGNIFYDDEYITKYEVDVYNTIIATLNDNALVKHVTLMSDHKYFHFSKEISIKLSKRGNICVHNTLPNIEKYRIDLEESLYEVIGSRIFVKEHTTDDNSKSQMIIYVCDEVNHAVKSTLLSFHHRQEPMIIYTPYTRVIKNITPEIVRLMRARLYKIEAAKKAKRVGLLVGTLSMERYLEMYEYLSQIIQKSGKTVYPMIVGKISAVKLTNFVDLDLIVVINCMESCLSFSDKADDYYKDVVTPYEMVCALHTETYNKYLISPYITDFRELLKAENRIDGINIEDDCEATMSMISGRIVVSKNNDFTDNAVQTLAKRLDSEWSVSSIDKSTRSWFGLDPNLGKDQVSMIVEGKTGIASGYSNETSSF